MNKLAIISAKIPNEVYNELALRIPKGERSSFICEAIAEKLQKTPRPDKIFQLEQRMIKLETQLYEIKNHLAELEVLTHEKGKVNIHSFCIDELDHKIVDYLLLYKGATTTELADSLDTNRWLVLNRLKKIQRLSKKQLGKAVIEYYAGEKSGRRKAWWIKEELVET